jgi:hypothetical protein
VQPCNTDGRTLRGLTPESQFNLFAAVTGTRRRNRQCLAGPSAQGEMLSVRQGVKARRSVHHAKHVGRVVGKLETIQKPASRNFGLARHLTAANLPGRTMARIGLRMMPPFPWSPLKFRTAGFPQYGFKAGVSGGAFPAARGLPQRSVCHRPSCTSLIAFAPRSVPGNTLRWCTSVRAA